MGEFSGFGTKAIFCIAQRTYLPFNCEFMKRVSQTVASAHRRSFTSTPCFFKFDPSNFQSSSHPSTLTFVSVDRPIDLRKSSAEPMAPELRTTACQTRQDAFRWGTENRVWSRTSRRGY
jgi:hypothetical protein